MIKKHLSNITTVSISLCFLCGFYTNANAQELSAFSIDSLGSKYINWYNMSPVKDKIQGVEVNRAYNELLINKKPKKTIVVAVIDSGIDIDHVDLKGRIWTNKKEIPSNGIDDDQNGYIDDVHGWNFLGNSKGMNILEENKESTRILRELGSVYDKINSPDNLTEAQKKEYELYKSAYKSYNEDVEKYKLELSSIEGFERDFANTDEFLINYLGKVNYTIDDVQRIESKDPRLMNLRDKMIQLFRSGYSKENLKKAKETLNMYLDKHYNLSYNPRINIISDNIKNINDKNYGNNNVKGPQSYHGTAVSGIIAGVRNNGIGVDGIADSVQIMVLRAVPDGDELDKDIALAIRYAVDNGANIINMSFGKDFSPQKEFIDDAVKYAEDHNVLIVHAAGNDGKNIDINNNYPTNTLNDGTLINSWITVGASSIKLNKKICGNFSNYGKDKVDLFALGVDMILLYPGNKYSKMDGTSFAGPVVSGVSALIWSYYPELSAVELKEIILQSCSFYPKLKVNTPSKGKRSRKVEFATLSKSGGIVNVFSALNFAENKVTKKL